MSSRRLTLVLGILATIGPLSMDMVLPSFPALARSLGVDVAAVQLTLAAYAAGVAAGQLLHGPLSDRFGRRPPLLAGLSLYTAAAVACAAAPSLGVLVAARFAQGLGACAAIVISRAVVRDRLCDREATALYSSRMLVMGAAPVLAPFAGGYLAAWTGWRGIFAALALVGVALLALVALGLPESLPPAQRRGGGPAAALRAWRTALADRRFVRLSLVGGASEAAMFACLAGAPFVFIECYGLAPERLGFVTGANALGIVAASAANRPLVRALGVERALRLGLAGAVLSYAVLAFLVRAEAGLAPVVIAMVAGISSVGVVLPNATASAMGASGARAGSASAALGLLQSTCDALAAWAVSALADGTARPMTTVMLACGALALALARSRADGVAPAEPARFPAPARPEA